MTNILSFRRMRDRASTSDRGPRAIPADLTGMLVGRTPHDFCLHLKFSGELGFSVASAPIWCRERIFEAGFPAGPAVALFTGRDLDGTAAFATVSTSDWRPTVLRLGAKPSYAFAERIHLLSWIGAEQPPVRRAMSAEIGWRISSYGNARRLGRFPTPTPNRRPDLDAGASAVLVAIAATAGDMFDGSNR